MANTVEKRKRRSQRDYTLGFKLAVVEQVEKGEMTDKQAQKIYGIQGRSTVLVWLRKHGKLDWRLPTLQPMMKSKETPAQKIKRLEQELADERDRNLILNDMVTLLEKQTGGKAGKKSLSGLPKDTRPKGASRSPDPAD